LNLFSSKYRRSLRYVIVVYEISSENVTNDVIFLLNIIENFVKINYIERCICWGLDPPLVRL
jgi:hypothetical protein